MIKKSPNSLPPFLIDFDFMSIGDPLPFGDTSPKTRQKSAIYALEELLKKSEALSFNEPLDSFNV